MVDILLHCHTSACGGHYGASKIAAKVLQSGFFWPTLFKDAQDFVVTCNQYQLDYVSKWVKAAALPTNNSKVVVKFLRKNIFTRFGVPRAIISDGEWRSKRQLGCHHIDLFFGKACDVPVELEHKAFWAIKTLNFDMSSVSEKRKLSLNELEELQNKSYESAQIYKHCTKKWHDKHILKKEFYVGQRHSPLQLTVETLSWETSHSLVLRMIVTVQLSKLMVIGQNHM
ncbi:unnamed protein product [Prunus armeniaca]